MSRRGAGTSQPFRRNLPLPANLLEGGQWQRQTEAQLHGHCLPKKKEAPVARLLSVVFFKNFLKTVFYRIKISPVNF